MTQACTPQSVATGRGWTMYLGDCLEVMARLALVDHVLSDPPYEAEAHSKGRRVKVEGGGGNFGVAAIAPITFAPMREEDRQAAGKHFARLCRRWCLVFCQSEAAHKWEAAVLPLRRKRWCIWVKPDGQPNLSGDGPGVGYETIVATHAAGRSRWNGGGRTGVFTHLRNQGSKNEHPTMKPVPLMVDLVEMFTDEGETVMDAYAGSGTTGVACLRLGRRFIGIESDPTYFALAVERLRAEEDGSTVQAKRAGQASLFGIERP